LEYKVDVKPNKFSTDGIFFLRVIKILIFSKDTTGGEDGDYDLETLSEKWKVVVSNHFYEE